MIVSIEFSSLWDECFGGSRDPVLARDARFEFLRIAVALSLRGISPDYYLASNSSRSAVNKPLYSFATELESSASSPSCALCSPNFQRPGGFAALKFKEVLVCDAVPSVSRIISQHEGRPNPYCRYSHLNCPVPSGPLWWQLIFRIPTMDKFLVHTEARRGMPVGPCAI